MKRFFTSSFLLLCFATFASQVQAATDSATISSIPETGVATPLIVATGMGVAMLASGKIFKKLQ